MTTAPEAPAGESTTTVHVAKKFLTMEEGFPEVEAVAVRDGRVQAVGTLSEVTEALGERDFVVDETFVDDVVCAGFIDQHLHPILGATTLVTEIIAVEQWDLPGRSFPAATTQEEYRSRLAAAEASLQDDSDWLLSWGYHELWHGSLNREVLDGISTSRPIAIWQRSCHEWYLNSAAIETLGITEANMAGKGPASENVDVAAGHWWEMGMNLLLPLIAPVFLTPERLIAGLQQMVTYLHQKGVTAFNEPGIMWASEPWVLYEQILGNPDTPFLSTFLVDARTQADSGMAASEAVADAEIQVARAPEGKVRLLPEQVKLFADGAIISQLMQMNDPYVDADGKPDPSHEGEWLMLPDTYSAFADAYWQAGWQLHTHVNGDRGLDMVLDTLEQAMIDHPRADHRAVIVHFANSTEKQVERIARLGAIVSANPYYVSGFADKFAQSGLGPDRADAMVRSASVLKHHIPLSFHSDLPMGPADPLNMVWCAVNRITQSGRVAGGEQCISVHDALRAVTIEAAYSWRMENELGSIAPGKAANFTVLAEDPYDVDPTKINRIPIRGTVYEGRWFPLPEAASGTTAQASLGAALSTSTTDHQGSGCSCDAARMVSEAIAQVLKAA